MDLLVSFSVGFWSRSRFRHACPHPNTVLALHRTKVWYVIAKVNRGRVARYRSAFWMVWAIGSSLSGYLPMGGQVFDATPGAAPKQVNAWAEGNASKGVRTPARSVLRQVCRDSAEEYTDACGGR